MPVLARAWQMLLKGIGEVGDRARPPRRGRDGADPAVPCRRPAAAGRSGPPADSERPAAPAPAPAAPPAPSGGGVAARSPTARRVIAGRTRARAAPRLARFRDVVALVAEQREAMLHAHLVHSVHLVRFAPPVIELRPEPEAPRDLAARLAALLTEATGTRWTIALSAAEPASRRWPSRATPPTPPAGRPPPITRWCAPSWTPFRARASTPCMMRAADAYGLPAAATRRADMPDFAPPDAGFPTRPTMEIDAMKNLAGLMKQAQQMQKKMEEMQAALEAHGSRASAGAGMVRVTLNGKGELQACRDRPEARRSRRDGDAAGPDRRRACRCQAQAGGGGRRPKCRSVTGGSTCRRA